MWNQQPVTSIDQVFKKPSEVAAHKTGLKILIWGAEDTRKTGFCLSCPPPVYEVDTELGAPPLFQHFVYCPKCQKHTTHILSPEGAIGPCRVCNDTNGVMKDIHWCDATFLNPNTDEPDPFVALQRLESTITLLKDVKKGTVCIDSGTDVWDWIQAWLEGTGKHKEGTLLRFEWAKAKQRWRQLLLRLMAKPLHFVMTAQTQDIYQGNEPTGEHRPRIQGASQHVFDIIIYAQKWLAITGNPPVKRYSYQAEITKCRFSKDFRPTIPDVTFDELTKQLKEKIGVEVW